MTFSIFVNICLWNKQNWEVSENEIQKHLQQHASLVTFHNLWFGCGKWMFRVWLHKNCLWRKNLISNKYIWIIFIWTVQVSGIWNIQQFAINGSSYIWDSKHTITIASTIGSKFNNDEFIFSANSSHKNSTMKVFVVEI